MTPFSFTRGCFGLLLVGAVCGLTPSAQAQVVPGTGNLLNYDDLEDVKWGYSHNFPKSSKEEDENIRFPLGASYNRMWSESPKRGAPDVVKRVETPAGGLAGSTGSLYLRTRDCGIPGHPGHKQAQDDFILSARPVAVGYSPNFVVRIFVPEFKDWEQRQGVSFGIRAGLQGMMTSQKPASVGRRLFGGSKMQTVTEMEPYYPGFFIAFNPVAANPAYKEDHAQILLRSDGNGHEVAGPKITQTGWWTFGMSVTSDSRCHYYAHAGIADLTAGDHIYSSLPYGIRGEHFNTIFFNVCSADNASSWSTPWIIDDPKVFYSGSPVMKPAPQQAQQPQPVKTAQAPVTTPNTQNASQSKEIPLTPGIPMTPASAPAATTPTTVTPAPVAPVPVAPVPAATTPVPMPAPLVAPAPAVNVPIPAVIAPALLSTEPAVGLKPVPPLTIPTSTPVEAIQTPAVLGPLLLLPPAPPQEAAESIVAAVTPPSPPATVTPPTVPVVLEGNPFDNAQTVNAKTPAPVVAEVTPVAPVSSPTKPAQPSSEEPPLVIAEVGDASTEVDSTPVPPPPAE